jgi:DNA-binding MarR family transcriptional regulator
MPSYGLHYLSRLRDPSVASQGNQMIEETIGFWLLLLSRRYRTEAQSRLASLGLFAGQDLLLMQLWEQDGQTQSELADRLYIVQATLTRMISRMAKKGLVLRKPDPDDGRVSRVFVTERGSKLKAPVESIWQSMEYDTFAGLTLEERLLLRRLLMQIHAEQLSD